MRGVFSLFQSSSTDKLKMAWSLSEQGYSGQQVTVRGIEGTAVACRSLSPSHLYCIGTVVRYSCSLSGTSIQHQSTLLSKSICVADAQSPRPAARQRGDEAQILKPRCFLVRCPCRHLTGQWTFVTVSLRCTLLHNCCTFIVWAIVYPTKPACCISGSNTLDYTYSGN